MATLRLAVGRDDREQVQAMAHDLAGSALVVGAAQLAALLREVDTVGPLPDLGGWVERVEHEHRRVIAALEERRG